MIAAGRVAAFTQREFELLDALHTASPRVLTKQQLLNALYWRGSEDEEPEIKIVDVFVCNIRKKLEGMPIEIGTAWGKGYRLIIQNMEQAI